MNQKPTIKQVAAAAGVSTQTISRVINGRSDVSEETRAHVQRVIDHMGYRPSAVARSLIGRRTSTIGVVASGLEYAGPSRTLTGIERQASELGFSLLLALLPDPATSAVETVLADMLSRRVEGIIWAVPEIGDNRLWVRELPRQEVPIVFLTMQPQPDLPVVAVDNRSGARLVTEHLLAQGRQRVGLITGPSDWWEARQRKLGWHDALATAGLSVQAEQVVEGDWSAASGEQAFSVLLEQFPQLDAIFASNDQMAQGVLHAAWRAGVRVPDDVAVVGFDDIPEALYFIPPLTTVRQESDQIGSTAVRVLTRLIESSRNSGRIAALESVWLRPELVVRASSAGPLR